MCGIAGVLLPSGAPDVVSATADVRAMLATLVHRGPDADGLWSDPAKRCVLGHRRLSIIDTSDAGRQPMTSTDGRWMITFNGEIYNYRELSPKVAAAGMAPRGRTDTEVLVNAIALWGTDALDKLDGQFAFAAFDTLTGRVILARDPFGEKPLYFLQSAAGGFAFASELQALERSPWFDGEVSADSVAELLMFQYVGAPRTIYEHVRKLEPGHWMVIDPGQTPRIGRYFRFAPGEQGFTDRPLPELVDELEGLLTKSIERRLIADVPLGAFLSGGVDSSTVCALVTKKLRRDLETFSIGFKGSRESEHEAARRFARHLGTKHFDQILAPSASEFLAGIGSLLDEPNADSSCMPTYLLSRFARQRVTVAVSGDGGDEMFGGYGRYFATLDEERAGATAPWSAGSVYYADRILIFTDPLVRDLMGELPAGLAGHLQRLRAEVDQGQVPLFCRLRRTDVENYMPGAVLPKVDRMSMRHSLEVRTPYLNVDLARFAERLPESRIYRDGVGKLLLRELAYRYLPRDLVDAPKKGFGLPMSRWARSHLLKAARDLLLGEDSRLRAAFGSPAMEAFVRRQSAWRGFATYQVWTLGMLESWLRRHPARTEQLTEAVKEAQEKRKPSRLRAVQLGKGLYALLEGNGKLTGTERARLTSAVMHLRLSDREHWDPAVTGPEHATSGIDFPPWGHAVPVSRALGRLKDSVLLLPSLESVRRLDYFELEKLRDQGVRKLIFSNPHVHDHPMIQLDIRQVAPAERALNAVRLFLSGVSWIAWRGRASAFLRRIARRSADRMYVSEALRGVDLSEREELFSRYMLFEGLRQLPPVPASHAEIAASGRGRYSVWEQRCCYSPTRLRRLLTRPYWVARRAPDRERLLQYVPRTTPREFDRAEEFAGMVERLAALRDAGRPSRAPLAPGDRVVLVTHALSPGGAERQWCYLAQSLKAAGYEVSFLVRSEVVRDSAHYRPLLAMAGIDPILLGDTPMGETITHAPAGRLEDGILATGANPFGAALAVAASTLRMLNPKAVFAQLDSINVLAGVAGLLADVPRIVLSFRNYSPPRFPYIDQTWLLPAYRALARSKRVAFCGNSSAGNDDYADWLGLAKENIALVPNAMEPAASAPDAANEQALRGELGLAADTPVILGVFRLSEEKRPEMFIDTCAEVIGRHPEVRAFIAGIGPMREAIAESIRARGLDRHIRLLGRRTDVDALMRISTLLLLTSRFEGMPNVVLEAQSAGLPVVAADVGGVADCLAAGSSGFLVEVGDQKEFVARCLQLVENRDIAKAMGESGKAHMKGFSKEALARRLVALANGEAEERPALATAARSAH